MLNPSHRGVEREHAGGADGAGDEGEDDVRGADDVEGAAHLNHASVIEDLQEEGRRRSSKRPFPAPESLREGRRRTASNRSFPTSEPEGRGTSDRSRDRPFLTWAPSQWSGRETSLGRESNQVHARRRSHTCPEPSQGENVTADGKGPRRARQGRLMDEQSSKVSPGTRGGGPTQHGTQG